MPKDTDGTRWVTIRYTIDVQVMAETADEAFYYAHLALPDYIADVNRYYAELVEED